MIGKKISHYNILEKLGAGGMGVVYKARDTKLDRYVAIKFLPPHLQADERARKRFVQEAKAASALEHDNICAIYEINETSDGQIFIVMPCYEGETLQQRLERGPLGIEESFAWAADIAAALSKAHEMDIVHRDIKPGNIFITSDSKVKIMDFGLAKLTDRTNITKTGTALGTVAYMSPEQAKGDEIDHRTDIWSLGVVLYEMLSAKQPFRGEYEPAVVYSIMNEEPELLSGVRKEIPYSCERMVEKALAKDPAKRHQSANEFALELAALRDEIAKGLKKDRFTRVRRLRRRKKTILISAAAVVVVAAILIYIFYPGRGMAIDSLAVLPLSNLSGDPEQEYFVEGMTEELTTRLAQISSLKVISRTSIAQYKDTDKSLPEIAEELGVDAIVEGAVMYAGEDVRITAKLIHAATEKHLWANSYKRDFRDVIALQSEVVRAITDEIRAKLTPQEEAQLEASRKVDPVAYQAILKGRYHTGKGTEEGVRKGLEYFRQALDIDPTSAEAYAGLAQSHAWEAQFGYRPVSEALSLAKAAAQKALELDPELADAHAALGRVMYNQDWDVIGSERELDRAIEINPNNIDALSQRFYCYLSTLRYEEAIEDAERLADIDPLNPVSQLVLGYVLTYSRKYDEAIAQFKKVLDLFPDFGWAYAQMGWAYGQKGMYEESCAACDRAMELANDQIASGSCATYYARAGQREKALEILDRLLEMPEAQLDPYLIAFIYWGLNERDSMFVWLERAYDEHSFTMPMLPCDFMTEDEWVTSDPRFHALLQKLDIPKYE